MGNRGLVIATERSVCRILYVAYPLLPVSNESCGGAEQMLSVLESEMAGRGYITTVAACAGSRASGAVFATGHETKQPDGFEQRNAEHEARILELVRLTAGSRPAFDLIHDKSGTFWRRSGECNVPVLATLHLPRHFYPTEAFQAIPENVLFNCVSESQCGTFSDVRNVVGVVPNGIQLKEFPFKSQKDHYLLWMGRICEEKGAHLAIEVAERTGIPLVLIGEVYPFSYHVRYYNERIRPHLGRKRPRISFFETPTLDKKVKLLANARALLVPSLVDETSSLASMEAMACGTPVIGLRRGAIPEVVIDGVTGFVVNDVDEMAEAVWRTSEINPHACRVHVETNHSATRMASEYEDLYERVSSSWTRNRCDRAA
jgi:glycosyltransferase involved in cell wall biosynthesis